MSDDQTPSPSPAQGVDTSQASNTKSLFAAGDLNSWLASQGITLADDGDQGQSS